MPEVLAGRRQFVSFSLFSTAVGHSRVLEHSIALFVDSAANELSRACLVVLDQSIPDLSCHITTSRGKHIELGVESAS